MKLAYRFFCLLFLFATNRAVAMHLSQPVDLDLDARASEYKSLQAQNFTTVLEPVIAMGERNLEWLKFINSKRATKLSFTSKATQIGYPMDQPKIYNTEIIQKSYDDLVTHLPKAMTDVLIGNAAFTENPPFADEIYVNYGLEIDRVYQSAVRWNSMQGYLGRLVIIRVDDVRGYHFLKAEADLANEFKNWQSLDDAKRNQLADWLAQICANTERDYDRCVNKVSKLKAADDFQKFYTKYFAAAEKHWNEYFEISKTRDDVKWDSSGAESMVVPFKDPNDASIVDFLKTNIEDEWKWMGWTLHLNILPNAETHIEFAPGQVPHVNGIAGSTITMDQNSPLTEYNVQWTIRHEYGHTLGFDDCYIEFYDLNQKAIVSYQFDTSNLMCSRLGHLKQIHFDALKNSYGNKVRK